MVERSLFRAKINSDYNDFVARVALEVVDSSWWKQQLRVKSAGSERLPLSSSRPGHRGPFLAFTRFLCQRLSVVVVSAWRRLDALEAAGLAWR
jgi:hypothetical protein